jgi:hypothetical protein
VRLLGGRTLTDAANGKVPEGFILDAEHALATPSESASVGEDSARLDFIERTFSGMTNRERYLPVKMIWGKGAMGRTLREACDKYMKKER